MESGKGRARERNVDEIALALPRRATMLSRLFLAHSRVQVSHAEAGVLAALSERPQRITELAAMERVTQPAISRLVVRLEERGWVRREDDPGDGRVVLVAITPAGTATVESLRAEYRALVHEEMAALPDSDVDTLARAIEVLDRIIAGLQARG